MQIDSSKVKRLLRAKGASQSELASLTGLSRGRLNTILNNSASQVRRGTLERIADAIGVLPDDLLSGGTLAAYRQFVAEENAVLDFEGMGLPNECDLPLLAIAVPGRARVVEDEEDQCSAERGAAQPVGVFKGARAARPLTDCTTQCDRILLLGPPGQGKTTSLRHLAATLVDAADEAPEQGQERLLPVLVRLSDYSQARERDQVLSPVAHVSSSVRRTGRPDPARVLEGELGQGRCLVMFDGLDEVRDPDRRRSLTECVQGFIAQYPKNHYILSSRRVGIDEGPWEDSGFTTLRASGWGRKEVELFLANWSALHHGHPPTKECHECSARTRELIDEIGRLPQVREIAANPLVLTILASLAHANVGLPRRRRADLYAKVVETFLVTWEASKRKAQPGDVLHELALDAREFEWFLSALALEMLRRNLTLAPRWWVADFLQAYLQDHLGFGLEEAKQECDRVIRYLTERSGLVLERGPDLFGYAHLTFQEYFASVGLLQESHAKDAGAVTKRLRDRMYDPRWQETVKLVAAQLGPHQADGLLRSILDDPDPVGRFLRRGQLLALSCVADGTPVRDRAAIEEVCRELTELGKSKWIGITMDAIDALAQLRDTRSEEAAEAAIAAILATARDSLSKEEWLPLHVYHEKPGAERGEADPAEEQDAAFGLQKRRVADEDVEILWMNPDLKRQHPGRWYDQIRRYVGDPDGISWAKEILVAEIGRSVRTEDRARETLLELLSSDAEEPVREICALRLEPVADDDSQALDALLACFRGDESDEVRGRCAAALKNVAARDRAIQEELRERLVSAAPEAVRGGCARGLESALRNCGELGASVTQVLRSLDEPEEVRVACAWALEAALGQQEEVVEALTECLREGNSPKLRRVAAQIFANALAEEEVGWSQKLIEPTEHILMTLEQPCPCALRALRKLADARETRAALRVDRVIRENLAPFEPDILLALVFGSVPQNRQTSGSDIDLLIVGDVSLKEVSQPLDLAEQTLGRPVNPVIYSAADFRQRYRSGNPFVLDIVRKPKLFIKGDEDELRAMVAERMAAAP